MSTITIDTTSDATIAASVATLGPAARHKIAQALRAAQAADNDASILNAIRQTLTQDTPALPAIGVLFSTAEWENGHYLDNNATALFSDGTTEGIEFDISDDYGPVRANFILAVDLRTATFDRDPDSDIHTAFGIPKPHAPAPPVD